MLCVKIDWNWPNGSGEVTNVKSLQKDPGQKMIRNLAHLSL